MQAVQMPENKFAEGSSVKFCFLEFRSVFECTAALTVLNGMDLLGNSLKVWIPQHDANMMSWGIHTGSEFPSETIPLSTRPLS